MTPPDHPPAAPFSSGAASSSGGARSFDTALPRDDGPVLRLRDQGELVAAVPAMLGFHPRESLVLMATGGRSGRRLGLTLRVDLPPPEHPEYPEHVEIVVASAVRGLLLDDPAGAVAVVVSESVPARGDPPGAVPHPRLADRLAQVLDEQGVHVHALMWAAGTAGGARWACYHPCGCAGVVPDPAATAFVAASVVEGRVVHGGRDALLALVAPADATRLRRREELMIRALEDPDASALVADAPAGLAVVDAAIDDAAAGRLDLSDARVVALAMALGGTDVRAAALQHCAGSRAAAAEQLWAALARETPDPEAAEPATLLAVSALLRGDGALANIALDRAERAWPGHAFSQRVRAAAEAGLRPSRVRELLRRATGAGIGHVPAGRRGRG